MELHITKKSKALRPICIDVPDFTVLIGLNGSGKTQILEGISGENSIVRIDSMASHRSSPVSNEKFIIVKEGDKELTKIKYMFPANLIPNQNGGIKEVNQFWQDYSQIKSNSSWNVSYNPIFDEIAEKAGKTVDELEESDFSLYIPLSKVYYPVSIFDRNLSSLINSYLKKYEANDYKRIKQSVGSVSASHSPLSEEIFDSLHEKPWIILDEVLSKLNIKYTTDVPNPKDWDRDSTYTFKLKNLTGEEININSLSSGEKVILSLAFAMYNADSDVDFPELLLLDEPDSSLHPAMSKQFIDVLLDLFVRDKGVKVIMTTHSPSTVALCPEESIYVVKKDGNQVEKISKDEALKILTSGIPTLSIDYRGHKQVIVESPTDVFYYQTIQNKLIQNGLNEDRLYFISNGYGKGNCQQVVDIVSSFNRSGNEKVRGIIDWDKQDRKAPRDLIMVHGENSRYSIENYVFDPIYIFCLFLETKAQNAAKYFSLEESYYQYSIGSESSEFLQRISDWFFKKFHD